MAASQSVMVKLGFQADTSAAEKSIQRLNQSLTNLQQIAKNDLGVSADLTEAANAAKILQENLAKAYNVNTGKLNFTQFNQSIQKSGTSVQALSQKLLNCGNQGAAAFAQLSSAVATMEIPFKKTNALLSSFMTTMKNTAKWTISSNIFHGLESGLASALSYAKNLDASLNDIRIVSGASASEMAKFATQANAAAKVLGTTTKAYADAAKIYYQQGDSAEQAAKKAEITLKAANVSFKANAQEMSEMLTAVWNSYQAGTDQLEHMVDVMAGLGSSTATSMEEIATAMQKVAATANTVGVSMEQMSSMIATISSATRLSAETVGTSMNTVLARMGSLKLGETLEDGVDLTKYTNALKSIGVNVLDAQNQLRAMGDVITEVGNKWQTLSAAQQAALANTIGGARQYTNLMALFSNWDKYQKNLTTAMGSNGTLDKMQKTFLEGWEGATAKAKASLEGLYNALIDTKGLTAATNSLASFLDVITDITKGLGGLPGILTQVGALLTTTFSSQIADQLVNMSNSVKGFFTSFSGMSFKEGFRSLFSESTAQRNYIAIASQMTGEDERTTRERLKDETLSQELDRSSQLILKRKELLMVEGSLTTAQKAQATAALDALGQQSSELTKLNDEYKTTISQVERLAKTFKSTPMIDEATKAMGYTGKDSYSYLNTRAADAFRSQNSGTFMYDGQEKKYADWLTGGGAFKVEATNDTGLTTLLAQYQKLETAAQAAGIAAQTFQTSINIDTGEAASGTDNLITKLDALKSVYQAIGADSSVIAQIDGWKTAIQNAAVGSDEYKQAVEQAATGTQTLANNAQGGAQAAFSYLNNTLHLNAASMAQLQTYCVTAGQALMEGKIGAEEFANGLAKLKLQSEGAKGSLTGVIQGLSRGLSLFSSMSTVIGSWDTSSLASKISSFGMITVGVISAINMALNSNPWGAVIAAVGMAIGAVVGVLQRKEQEAKELIEKHKEAVSSWQLMSDEAKKELETNQELLDSYTALLAKKAEGQDVNADLITAGMLLIEQFQLEGQELKLLRGEYEAVAEAARVAAVSRAEEKGAEAIAKARSTTGSLIGNAKFEGEKHEMWDTDSNNPNAIMYLRHFFKNQMQPRLEGEYLAGYKGWTHYSSEDDLDAMRLYTSDWNEQYQQAIEKGGLSNYLFTSASGGFSNWNDPLLLVSRNGDTEDYRLRVYQAMEDTLVQLEAFGLQNSEFYSSVQKVYEGWKPTMELAERRQTEAKEAIDVIIQAEGTGLNGQNTSWDQFLAVRQAVYDRYQSYADILGLDSDEKIWEAVDAQLTTNFSLGTHILYQRLIDAAKTSITNPTDQAAYDAAVTQYIAKNGVASLNEQVLNYILAHYKDENFDVENNEELKTLTSYGSNTSATTKTDMTKIQEAQKALKADMTTEDFTTAMQKVLTWGENGIVAFSDFCRMTYDEQVQYLKDLEQAQAESNLRQAHDQLAAANIAQKEFQAKKTQWLTDNKITDSTELERAASMYSAGFGQAEIQSLIDHNLFDPENGSFVGDITSKAGQIATMWNAARAAAEERGETLDWETWINDSERNWDSSLYAAWHQQEIGYTWDQITGMQDLMREEAGLLDPATYAQNLTTELYNFNNSRLANLQTAATTLQSALKVEPSTYDGWVNLADALGMTVTEVQALSSDDLRQKVQATINAGGIAEVKTREELLTQGYTYKNAAGESQTVAAWDESSGQSADEYLATALLNNPNLIIGSAQTKNLIQSWFKSAQDTIKDNTIDLSVRIKEQDLTRLKAELQALQNIDVTVTPTVDSQAEKVLKSNLQLLKQDSQDATKTWAQGFNWGEYTGTDAAYQAYLAADKWTRADMLAAAERSNIELQRTSTQAAIASYESDSRFSDFSTLYANGSRAIDGAYATQYANYVKLKQEEEGYTTSIEQSEENRKKNYQTMLEAESSMVEMRQKQAVTEAQKTQAQAEALASATKTGQLTAAQEAQLSETDLAKWKTLTTETERAAFVADKWSKAAIQGRQAYSEQEKLLGSAKTALEGLTDLETKSIQGNKLALADYLKTTTMTHDEQAQVLVAYDNLMKKGVDVASMTDGALMQALSTELSTISAGNEELWNKYKTTAITSIKSVYSGMSESARQAAQEQLSIWESTFSQIANLMKTALSGEDVMKDVTSSWTNYLQAYLNSSFAQSGDVAGFQTALNNGTLNDKNLILPTFNANSIKTQLGIGANAGLFTVTKDEKTQTEQVAVKTYAEARDERIAAIKQEWIDSGQYADLDALEAALADKETGADLSAQLTAAAEGYLEPWIEAVFAAAFPNDKQAQQEAISRYRSGTMSEDDRTALKGAYTNLGQLAANYGVDANTATQISLMDSAAQGSITARNRGTNYAQVRTNNQAWQNNARTLLTAMESGSTFQQAWNASNISSETLLAMWNDYVNSEAGKAAGAQALTEADIKAEGFDWSNYFTAENAKTILTHMYDGFGAAAAAAFNSQQQDAHAEGVMWDAIATAMQAEEGSEARTVTLADGSTFTYSGAQLGADHASVLAAKAAAQAAYEREQNPEKATTYEQEENTRQKMARLSSAMSGMPQNPEDIQKLVELMGGTHTAKSLMTNWNTKRKQYYSDLISAMDTQLATFTTEEQKASAEYQALNAQRQAAQEQSDQWNFQTGIISYNQELERLKTNLETIQSIDFNTWTEQNAETQLKFAHALGFTTNEIENLSKLTEEEFIAKKYGAIKSNLESQKTQAQNIATAYLDQVKNDEGYQDFANIYQKVSSGEATLESFGLSDTMLAAYEQYASYMRQVQQYEEQIANNDFAQAQEEKAIATRKRNNAEQSQIEQWNKELEDFNKKSEKAKNVYEALSSSIETGQLTQAQKANFVKDSPLLTMWNNATTAAERARVAMAAAYEATSTQQEALDKQIAATKKFANGAGQVENVQTTKNGRANWEDESSFIENLYGDISKLTDVQVATLSQAYQATVKIVPEWKTNPTEFLTEFYKQLSNMNTEYSEQQTNLMNQLTDNITNLYSTLGTQEQAAAQAAVQAWTSAFNQIKSIRQSLLSGGSAMELIAGSPEQAIAMWQGYLKKNPNATVEGFLNAAGSGQITADTYGYATADSYLTNARKQYGIDYATWQLDGKTYYGAGANFDKSMDRAATALGVTYDAKGGNVKWHTDENGGAGYFTIEGSDEHLTAAQLTEKASSGGLTIGQDQMQAYLTPFWSSALQQTTNATTGQNYTATEATALIAAAMSGGQESEEWEILTTALGTVDSGLQAFTGALSRSTAATEAFTNAQHKAEENETKASNASRLSSVLESFATDTSGTSWEDYAKQHGLTDTEILSGITHENARTTADTYWDNEIKAYEAAAADYSSAAAGLLEKGFTTESVEYKRLMRAAESETQKAAAARGRQLSADAANDEAEKQKTMQKAISPAQDNIKQLGESLSTLQNLDLSAAPTAGTEAYNKLATAIQACNTAAGETKYTMDQLTKGSMLDRITAKYKMQKELLSQQATEQAKIVKAYEDRYDFENADYDYSKAIEEGKESEYQAYLDAKRQQAAYESEANATDVQARAEKSTVYEEAYARVQKATEKVTQQITKLQSSADILSGHVLDGYITAAERATLVSNGMGEAAIQAFEKAATAGERADIVANAYSETLAASRKNLIKQNGFINAAELGLVGNKTLGDLTGLIKPLTAFFGGKDAGISADTLFNRDAFLDSLKGLAPEVKGLLGKAWDSAKESVGLEASTEDFMAAMQSYLEQAKAENAAAWNQISAQAVSQMTAAYDSMTESARAAAQSQIEIWSNVFETIANLMSTLANGQSISSAIAGDTSAAIIAIHQLMQSTGDDLATVQAKLKNGTYSLDDFELPTLANKDSYYAANGFDLLRYGSMEKAYAAKQAREETIETYTIGEGENATVAYRYKDAKTGQYVNSNETEYAQQLSVRNSIAAATKALPTIFAPVTKKLTDGTEVTMTALRAAEIKIGTATNDMGEEVPVFAETLDQLNQALYDGNEQAWEFVDAQTELAGAGQEVATSLKEQKTEYEQNRDAARTRYTEAKAVQSAAYTAYDTVSGWKAGMTTQDKMRSLQDSTGLNNAQLLSLLNKSLGTEYQDLATLLKNVDAKALATALEQSSGQFADTVTAAATDFYNIVMGAGELGKNDRQEAVETMAEAEALSRAQADHDLEQALSEGGWETISELIKAVKNRDYITDRKTNLTDEDFDTTAELAFWGQAAKYFDDASAAWDTLRSAVSGTDGALATFKDTTKSLVDQLDALETIQGALEAIFGTGVEFSGDWISAHLKDIEAIATKGEKAVEALKTLRKELLEQYTKDNEWQDAEGDLSIQKLSLLDKQLKFGDHIEQQDLARIQNYIKQNKLTESEIENLGKILGVTFKIEKAIKIPETADEVKGLQKEINKTIELSKKGQATETQINQAASKFVAIMASGKADAAELKDTWDSMDSTMQDAVLKTAALTGNAELFQQALELATGADLSAIQNMEITANGTVVWENANDPSEYITKDIDGTITYHAKGSDIKMTKRSETAKNTTSYSGSGSVKVLGLTVPFSYDYKATGTTTTEIPIIDGTNVSDATGGGNDNGGNHGGGGGGGGGGNTPKHTTKVGKTERDENDRFHQINKLIERQQSNLDRIDKLKSRAYGADHLKAMNAEIDAMRQMIGLQEDYLREATAYATQLQKQLESMGAVIEDGVIMNQADLIAAWAQAYTDAVDQWNNMSAEEQENAANQTWFEHAENVWNEQQNLIQSWEDAQDTIREIKDQIADYVNQISAQIAEQIQEKITLRFEIDDREFAYMDRVLERYDGHLDKSAERFEILQQKLRTYAVWDENGNILEGTAGELGEAVGGELGSLMNRMKEAEEQHNKYLEWKKDADEGEWYMGEGLTDSDYAEVLKEIESKWADILSNIDDTIEAMGEVYSEMLDLAETDLTHLTDQLDHVVSNMESYIEMQQLMGQGETASDLTKFYETKYSAQSALLQQATTHLQDLQTMRADLVGQFNSLTPEEQKGTFGEMLKSQIDDLDERIQEAEDTQLDHWKATLETAQEILENKTAAYLETMDKAIDDISGSIGGLSELEKDYEWYKTEQERYVSTSKELYEVSKLNRDINNSIADATTRASKARLKALQEVINKQAEENRLTEYDIKMMELQYQHALALQELEEARNAKSVVRLTRDENGNYGYQYTANLDDVNEAEQKVNDKLQEINELAAGRVSELEQMQISTMRNYYDKVAEINADTTLSDEERLRELTELTKQTQDQLLFIQGQYENAHNALIENQMHVQERYGETIRNNTGLINDQLSAQIGALIMANATTGEEMMKAIGDGGALKDALSNYSGLINQANTAAGQTAGTAASQWENLGSKIGEANTAIANTKTGLEAVNTELRNESDELTKALGKWRDMATIFDQFRTGAENIDLTQLRTVIQTLAGNYEDTEIGGTGENDGNESRQTKYGYTWNYNGLSGTSLGFSTQAAALAEALNDIKVAFQQEASKFDSNDTENGGATAHARVMGQMESAMQQFKIAARKLNNGTVNTLYTYDTGGLNDFTGPAWLDGTRAHPELVLNATDTANMLDIVAGVRDLINNNVLSMLYGLSDLSAAGIHGQVQELQQNVQITAEFPNATDHSEIEQAFNDIINMATQYANRR